MTKDNKIFIIKRLKNGVDLKRSVIHTLKQSFATHLLEHGTDLRYIQERLRYNSSKTTEIYTHITKNGMEKIKNLLDELDILLLRLYLQFGCKYATVAYLQTLDEKLHQTAR